MAVGAIASDLTKKLPSRLFAGLGDMPGQAQEEEYVEQNITHQQEIPVYRPNTAPIQQAPVHQPPVQQYEQLNNFPQQESFNIPVYQEPQKSAQQIFLEQVFAKLMQNSKGDDHLQVTINLNLGFNIDKLKETMDMLDLDSLELVTYIVKNLVTPNKVNNAISTEINRRLTSPSGPIPIYSAKSAPVQEIPQYQRPEPVQYVQQVIEEPIIEERPPVAERLSAVKVADIPDKEPWELIEMKEQPAIVENFVVEEKPSVNMSKLLERVQNPVTVEEQLNDLENKTKNLLSGFMNT
jgi:hypothetical protein